MKRRPRSNAPGWKPKEKFTCGLNVTQEEWDRIFGKKRLSGTSQEGATPSTEAGGSNPQHRRVDGVTVNGEPAAQSS